MKFDFKNGKTYFELLISPSFDELRCSTIVHKNPMEHMFLDLPFSCTKKVPKNHNYIFSRFRHGGGTHYLVLAQTLIYSETVHISKCTYSVPVHIIKCTYSVMIKKPLHKSAGNIKVHPLPSVFFLVITRIIRE